MDSEFPVELQSETFKALSSNDNTALETLFSHLYSPQQQQQQQQQQRSQAIAFLQCCKYHHPDLLMIKLFFLLTSGSDIPTRAYAARTIHYVQPGKLWPKLRPKAQARLQSHVMHFLTQETSIHVLRLTAVVLAEIVSVIYQTHQHWPEIIDFLLSSVTSKDDKFREFALLVFASLQNDSRLVISDTLRNGNGIVPRLHSSILSSLSSRNLDIQVASFGAVASLIRLFSEPSLFHDLLRAMMVSVFTLLHGYEKTYFKSAFSEFVNLVLREPVLLKPYMSDMILDMLQIAENTGLSEGTHRLAFELVTAMTELKECEQVLVNLPHQTVIRLFIVPMKMLENHVEENELDGEIKEGDEDVNGFGIKCLKKLCVGVGGSKIVSVVYELLLDYLDATEWKKRQAGITLLTVIAKEFSDEMVLMENILVEMVTKILKLFQDPHVQVRLAVFTFMEMPINFVQVAQLLYHHRFVHAFTMALVNDQDQKVKEQVASAMLFFLKNTLPESLALYQNVDILMGKLLLLLQDRESSKQRNIAVSIINIIAERCHEVADKYYANYLPFLLEVCSDKNSEIKEVS